MLSAANHTVPRHALACTRTDAPIPPSDLHHQLSSPRRVSPWYFRWSGTSHTEGQRCRDTVVWRLQGGKSVDTERVAGGSR